MSFKRYSRDAMAMVIALPDIGLMPKPDQAGYFGGFITEIWPCPDCGKLDCERSCVVYADDPEENPQGCLVQTMALHLGVDNQQDLLQGMITSNKEYDAALERAREIVSQVHALVNTGQLDEAYLLAVFPSDVAPMVTQLMTDGSIEANRILADFSWKLADAASQIVRLAQGQPDPEAWLDKMTPSLSSALKYVVGVVWEKVKQQLAEQAANPPPDFGLDVNGMPILPNQSGKVM